MTALQNVTSFPGIYFDLNSVSGQSPSLIPNNNPTHSQQSYHEIISRRAKDEDLQILENLKDWPENWDGCNAIKPEIKAIEEAKKFVNDLFLLKLKLREQWISPNITASSEGEVVLEWWKNQKKVTIYITSSSIIYIKVPSESIQEMEDGVLYISNFGAYINLFSWLDEQ
jgi:hypothetical protein